MKRSTTRHPSPARAAALPGDRNWAERYRELLEGLGVALYTTDPAGHITFFNEAAAELWGRRPELGRDTWCGSLRLFWPDGTPMAHDESPLAVAVREGRSAQGVEVVAERPDGTHVSFLPYPTLLRNASGQLVGTVNVIVDITDRKRMEDQLRESENGMALALEAGGMGTWEWNVGTGEVTWSEGLEVMHGLAPGAFGGTFEDVMRDVLPADRAEFIASTTRALETGRQEVEYRIVLPDGAVRWVAGKGRVSYDAAGKPQRVLGVCMDITQRKNAVDRQRFLSEAGAMLASSLDYDTVLAELARLIVDAMADWCAIDMIDEDGSVRRLVVAHADPGKADVARELERYVAGTDRAPDFVAALAHGETFLFTDLTDQQLAAAALDETHYQIMRDLGFRSAMIVPLLGREKLLGAITFVCAESRRTYNEGDRALAKELAARAALAVDNARLYGEAQRVQEELRQANETKDEFLGLVSHELRTPITTIYGGVRLLRTRATTLADESRQEILRDIAGETERLHRIVEDLLVLARAELGQDLGWEPVLLQHVIPNAVRAFTERTLHSQVDCSIEPGLPPVAGEVTYIEQVLRNLLSNAEKYSPPGSTIEVRAEHRGSDVLVRVLDEGPGIEPEEAEAIFERFYRSPGSRQKTSGMGLGLTVCKRLIEAQGGRIWALPRPSGGLEVGFALPSCAADDR